MLISFGNCLLGFYGIFQFHCRLSSDRSHFWYLKTYLDNITVHFKNFYQSVSWFSTIVTISIYQNQKYVVQLLYYMIWNHVSSLKRVSVENQQSLSNTVYMENLIRILISFSRDSTKSKQITMYYKHWSWRWAN